MVWQASKAAVLSFFETLRMEVGSDVDISVVTPGMVETSLANKKWLEEVHIYTHLLTNVLYF